MEPDDINFDYNGLLNPTAGVYGQTPTQWLDWVKDISVGQGENKRRAITMPYGPTNIPTIKYIEDINKMIGAELGQYNDSYARIVDAVERMNNNIARDNAILTGKLPESSGWQSGTAIFNEASGLGQDPTGAYVVLREPTAPPLYEPKKAVQDFQAMPNPEYEAFSLVQQSGKAYPPSAGGGSYNKNKPWFTVPAVQLRSNNSIDTPSKNWEKAGGANANTLMENLFYFKHLHTYTTNAIYSFFSTADPNGSEHMKKYTMPFYDSGGKQLKYQQQNNKTISESLFDAVTLQFNEARGRYKNLSELPSNAPNSSSTIAFNELDRNGNLTGRVSKKLKIPMLQLNRGNNQSSGDYYIDSNGNYKLTPGGENKIRKVASQLRPTLLDVYNNNTNELEPMMRDLAQFDGPWGNNPQEIANAKREFFVHYFTAVMLMKLLYTNDNGSIDKIYK